MPPRVTRSAHDTPAIPTQSSLGAGGARLAPPPYGIGIVDSPAQQFQADFKSNFANIWGAGQFGGLSATELSESFSENQRKQLYTFWATKEIPVAFFTGDATTDDMPSTRRLMIAASILEAGHRKPTEESVDKKTPLTKHRANSCGHWTQEVITYAGASPARMIRFMDAPSERQIDPNGEVVFGGASARESAVGGLKDSGKQLKDTRTAPNAFRFQPISNDDFNGIQAGDWIMYFANNSEADGGHSVMFAEWTSGPTDAGAAGPDPYVGKGRRGEANVFQQATYKDDPSYVPRKLSNNDLEPKHCTVTHRLRVRDDASPPRSVEDLLKINVPRANHLNLEKIGQKWDFKKIANHLVKVATSLLETGLMPEKVKPGAPSKWKVDGEQTKLFREAIASGTKEPTITAISNLVATCQKLSQARDGFTVDGILENKWLPADRAREDSTNGPAKVASVDVWVDPSVGSSRKKPPPRSLDFDRVTAVERNRAYLDVISLSPSQLIPEIAKTLAARLGEVTLYDQKHRAQTLYGEHKQGRTLESLSVLIALWQFTFTSAPVTGWTTNLEPLVGTRYTKDDGGKRALTTPEERATLKAATRPG